ncbi:MAG: DUF1566 domain-containing protein, partial [Candidatus Parcubacteria bacterium]|nr:DUF1566 domain-containing protein [Candidatus Parcubacteria bacterium]
MKKYISLFLVLVAVLGLTIGLAKAIDVKTYQGSITSINYNDSTFILSSSPIVKVVTNTNTNISFKSGSTTVIKPFSNLKTGMVVTVIGIPSISLSSNPATIVTASEVKATGALTATTKPLSSVSSVLGLTTGSTTITHNECRNARCYKVSGAGDSQCKVDSDCQTANTVLDTNNLLDTQREALIKQLQEQLKALMAQLQELINQQQNAQTYFLRGTGPAGGIIFYDKGYESDGWRYLEVAPSDQSTGATWGCYGTVIPGADGAVIGTGHQNTHDMISAGCTNAAQLAHGVTIGGYSDWFLPSKDELNQMYVNLKIYGVGNFVNSGYWSSSENSIYAWSQNFNGSGQGYGDKSAIGYLRAIRAFSSLVNRSPVIDSVSGPTQLKINESGTWTIKAHDPENGYLGYSVKWGDEVSGASLQTVAPAAKQTTTFTHTYSKAGTYTVEFTVTDDKNQTAKSTMTVKIAEPSAGKPDLIVSSLSFDPGTPITNQQAKLIIKIKNIGAVSVTEKFWVTVAHNRDTDIISDVVSGYKEERDLLPGQEIEKIINYTFRSSGDNYGFTVVIPNTNQTRIYNNETYLPLNESDISNNSRSLYFSVLLRPAFVDLKINGSNNPAAVNYNSIITASWSSSDVTDCYTNGHYVPIVGGGIWGEILSIANSGTKQLYARHNTLKNISPLEIGIQCVYAQNHAISYTDMVRVPVIYPTISIILPANNAQLTAGASQNITWQYTGDKNLVSKYILYFWNNVDRRYDLTANITDKDQTSYTWTIPNKSGTGHY